MKRYKIIRYIEYEHLFELFFVSAILAIIGLRLYLSLTGWPTVGGDSLHIAHMLWGGFLMVGALLGFMSLLNEDFKPFFAVLGGLGFGTFIDELGKFITRDNDYFYRPTFALIYLIFLGLFLLVRLIGRRKRFTRSEYLVNSLELLKEAVINDLDKKEKAAALEYLSKSDPDSPITKFLEKSFEEVEHTHREKISFYTTVKNTLTTFYHFLIAKRWFLRAVVLFFIARSIGYLITGFKIIFDVVFNVFSGTMLYATTLAGTLSFIQFAGLILQAGLTAKGVSLAKRSRKQAYTYFKYSVLVSIFLLQAFNFYHNPVTAAFSVAGDLILLSVLNYMITKEDHPPKSDIISADDRK